MWLVDILGSQSSVKEGTVQIAQLRVCLPSSLCSFSSFPIFPSVTLSYTLSRTHIERVRAFTPSLLSHHRTTQLKVSYSPWSPAFSYFYISLVIILGIIVFLFYLYHWLSPCFLKSIIIRWGAWKFNFFPEFFLEFGILGFIAQMGNRMSILFRESFVFGGWCLLDYSLMIKGLIFGFFFSVLIRCC